MKTGRIPDCMFPIQSGVGVKGNEVMTAIGHSNGLPPLELYSEVIQDSAIDLISQGKIAQASCAAMTCTNECIQDIYKNIDFFSKHITICPSKSTNSLELIRRFAIIAMNTALECNLYDKENSSHICGSKLMNGIGVNCDYEHNGSISIFNAPSVTKDGKISAIVLMCSHVDSTEHDVDVIVTEYEVADLREKGPLKRAVEIINNCAHPDYRPILREFLRIADKGHEPESMRNSLTFHDTFLKKGYMRLTEFGEYF
jgi:acyl-CoA hydrolase